MYSSPLKSDRPDIADGVVSLTLVLIDVVAGTVVVRTEFTRKFYL